MSKDAPEFFPPSGSFQSVVPLSELAETPGAPESAAPAPPSESLEVVAQARPVAFGESERRTPEDEDEATLVPERHRASKRALAPRPGRRKSRLPSWRFTVPCLAAMLVGGVIADAFWKNVRRPLTADEPASVSEEAPTAADAEAPGDQPPPATDEADTRQPQTAPQAPAPEQAVMTESEAVGRAADDARGVPEVAGPKGTRTISAEITSATVIVSPAARRAAAAVPAADSRAKQPSPSRVAGDKSAAEPRPVRREARPAKRPRGAQNPVLSSSSRDQSLPVFSPPPSGKQGKKDVIQWP